MNRRRFLKASGFVVGAGALGFGGGLWTVQPRRQSLPLPTDNDARPERLSAKKRVVVVGGGLAGLTAATELAARRFDVTLVERAPQLGGKLTALDGARARRGVPRRARLPRLLRAVLQPARAARRRRRAQRPSAVAGLPGAVRRPAAGDVRPDDALLPVQHAVGRAPVARAAPRRLPPRRRRAHRAHEASTASARSPASTASTSRASPSTGASTGRWSRRCSSRSARRRSTASTRLSAAEAIRFFHFYFMGNPEGLGFSYLVRDSVTAIVEPMRRRLESLGGRVVVGKGARRLVLDGGRVARVVVDARPAPEPRVTLALADVPATGWRGLPAARRLEHLRAPARRRRSRRSTAAARTWAARSRSTTPAAFAAPATAAASTATASPRAARPSLRSRRSRPSRDGDRVLVGDAPTIARRRRGRRQRAARLRLLRRRLRSPRRPGAHRRQRSRARRPRRGRSAKPTPTSCGACGSTSRPRPIACPSTRRRASASPTRSPSTRRSRSRSSRGRAAPAAASSRCTRTPSPPRRCGRPPRIRAAMWRELVSLLPELAGARVLHDEFQQQSNFTRWAPGDHARRPGTTTPVANLMLAGDHVRLPAPASLMEAAAMSGRLAANAIARPPRACSQLPIPTVALKGPLAVDDRPRARRARPWRRCPIARA